MEELQLSELTYYNAIKTVLETYRKPLIDEKALSTRQIGVVFLNLDEIVECSQKLIDKIELYNESKNEGFISVFGDFKSDFKPYLFYCLNLKTALERIDDFKDQINGDLKTHLEEPLLRIKAYPLLIQKLLENASKPENIQSLQESLKQAKELINKIEQSSEKLLSIQTQFSSSISLMSPGRDFIREDAVYLIARGSKKPRRILLFNDIVLVVKKDWRDKYHLVSKQNLIDLVLYSYADSPEYQHVIGFVNGSHSHSFFSMTSLSAKSQWINEYKTQAKSQVIEKSTGLSDAFLSTTLLEEEKDAQPTVKEKDLDVKVLLEQSIEITRLKTMLQEQELTNSSIQEKLKEKELVLTSMQATNAEKEQYYQRKQADLIQEKLKMEDEIKILKESLQEQSYLLEKEREQMEMYTEEQTKNHADLIKQRDDHLMELEQEHLALLKTSETTQKQLESELLESKNISSKLKEECRILNSKLSEVATQLLDTSRLKELEISALKKQHELEIETLTQESTETDNEFARSIKEKDLKIEEYQRAIEEQVLENKRLLSQVTEERNSYLKISEEKTQLTRAHFTEVELLEQELSAFKARFNELESVFHSDLESLKSRYSAEIGELKELHAQEKNEYNNLVQKLVSEIENQSKEYEQLTAERNSLKVEYENSIQQFEKMG